MAVAASAARAVPCQRKCSKANPSACIMLGDSQLLSIVVIGDSFHSRPAGAGVPQLPHARTYGLPAHASLADWPIPRTPSAACPPQAGVWSVRREGMLHRRAHVGLRFALQCLLWS